MTRSHRRSRRARAKRIDGSVSRKGTHGRSGFLGESFSGFRESPTEFDVLSLELGDIRHGLVVFGHSPEHGHLRCSEVLTGVSVLVGCDRSIVKKYSQAENGQAGFQFDLPWPPSTN